MVKAKAERRMAPSCAVLLQNNKRMSCFLQPEQRSKKELSIKKSQKCKCKTVTVNNKLAVARTHPDLTLVPGTKDHRHTGARYNSLISSTRQ